MYYPGSISLCLQLSITEYMKALYAAELSLPILPAFLRFIFSFLTLCSLMVFEISTFPLSKTRFMAGYSARTHYQHHRYITILQIALIILSTLPLLQFRTRPLLNRILISRLEALITFIFAELLHRTTSTISLVLT